MKTKTKVYFIGAGPGDAELMTLKAVRILKMADIIIYAGSLVERKNMLKFAKRGVSLYNSATMDLEGILDIFSKAKSKNKIVARAHSGDPSIYGAIQEQMDWCRKKRISYEVVPGVSSFQAAAATLKQEFTLPSVTQTVILTRVSGRTPVPDKEDLEKLSKIRATIVIFLSIQEIERVVNRLRQGYKRDTPVAVIERVSYPDERKILGTLQDIAKKVKASGIKRQALIIVGDCLRGNYQKSKLYDKDFEHSFRKTSC